MKSPYGQTKCMGMVWISSFTFITVDETQRLLDSAVEDNLIKLENKIGTKGTKSGIEEKAYRLPTLDMLTREKHDWWVQQQKTNWQSSLRDTHITYLKLIFFRYCWHCHSGGEILLCSSCQRVFHESCLKTEYGMESVKIDTMTSEWTCPFCKVTF